MACAQFRCPVSRRLGLSKRTFILFFAFFLWIGAGGAEPAGSKKDGQDGNRRAEEIVSRLQHKYEATRTLATDFEQENHLRTLGQVTRSKGRLLLEKPGRLRAEYTEPEKQLIVSNGKRLWIYTPRLNQVIVGDVGGGGSLPLLFLAGKGKLSREFRIALVDEGVLPRQGGVWRRGQPHRLSLDPIAPASAIRRMWLEADPVDYRITGLEYEDALGNRTRIRFSNMKEGTSHPRDTFEFDIPPKAEVLKTPSRKQR